MLLVDWCIGVLGEGIEIRFADRHWAVGIVYAFGAVIGVLVYWYIGGRALALHAGLKSRLHIHIKGSVAKQRPPKLFTIHHSSFIIRKRSFRFLIPHFFVLKGARK
ncbi:hypothetical protein [Nitratifractor sp.]